MVYGLWFTRERSKVRSLVRPPLICIQLHKTGPNDQADIRHPILAAQPVGFKEYLPDRVPDPAVVLAPIPTTTATLLQIEIGANSLEDLSLRRCHSSGLRLVWLRRRVAACAWLCG
jgi:hypothetical protein